MANRIRKDDQVKIISGSQKGVTGKVLAVSPRGVLIEGVGVKTRHIRPSQLNPRGGKKEIQVPIALSKVALVADEKSGKTSRVGYRMSEAGQKIRIAKQLKAKEIK